MTNWYESSVKALQLNGKGERTQQSYTAYAPYVVRHLLWLPFARYELLRPRTGCTRVSFKQLRYYRNIFLSCFFILPQSLEPIRLKFLHIDPEHILGWPLLLSGKPVELLYLVDAIGLKKIVAEGPCFGIGLVLFSFIKNRKFAAPGVLHAP